MKAHDDLTFNVIGATIESPSQNPPACLYKPRVCGNKEELLRRNPCPVWLSLARPGAGLADSRLTSPRDSSALLREVPLPLSFCGAPPARLFVTPWTIAHQAPLSRGFTRQEHWSGLLFPTSGNLPDPGMEPASPALAGKFFTTEPAGKHSVGYMMYNMVSLRMQKQIQESSYLSLSQTF